MRVRSTNERRRFIHSCYFSYVRVGTALFKHRINILPDLHFVIDCGQILTYMLILMLWLAKENLFIISTFAHEAAILLRR